MHLAGADGPQIVAVPDRRNAMGVLITIRDSGARVERVTFGGKQISQSQREDLVADAYILNSILETADREGVSLEVVFERGLEKEQMKVLFAEAARHVSRVLKISDERAYEVLFRRSARGTTAISTQQAP